MQTDVLHTNIKQVCNKAQIIQTFGLLQLGGYKIKTQIFNCILN